MVARRAVLQRGGIERLKPGTKILELCGIRTQGRRAQIVEPVIVFMNAEFGRGRRRVEGTGITLIAPESRAPWRSEPAADCPAEASA